MNTCTIIPRSAIMAIRQRASSKSLFSRAMATQAKKAGQNIFFDDKLEWLDDMIKKTDQMEASLDKLKETYEKKRIIINDPKANLESSIEMDRLFQQASDQKANLDSYLASLRVSLDSAKKAYAVDAPDGEADWHLKEEFDEIGHIIDDAAVLEDKDAIIKAHKLAEDIMKSAPAVDAPDGEADWHVQAELEEIDHIIDDAARLEDKEAIMELHNLSEENARKGVAVDAPDGEADWHVKEELEEVDHLIDDAAKLEDKEKITKIHKMEEQIRKSKQNDPMHMWD